MARGSLHQRYRTAGDSGVIVCFDDHPMDEATVLARQLAQELKDQPPPFAAAIRDLIPGLNNVCIQYDARLFSSDEIKSYVDALLPGLNPLGASSGTHWCIPAVYGGEYGPDLNDVAAATGLDPDEVIQRHTARPLTVAIMGFMPGLGYLKGVDEALYLPRKSSPRAVVPARSLGIAMDQSVIYPLESPGGWNLIGRVPVRPFDPAREDPILFRPGDRVSFTAVDAASFADLEQRVSAGEQVITTITEDDA
ncbi:MAG: 5-oxoprolinase subunit PxpB [Candidatus Puniceispirillales bacterium]